MVRPVVDVRDDLRKHHKLGFDELGDGRGSAKGLMGSVKGFSSSSLPLSEAWKLPPDRRLMKV